MTLNCRIIPIPILKDNYVWTIISSTGPYAIIIDPGEAPPILQYLQAHHLQLHAIFVTHHHWDHSNGLVELKKRYDVPIFGKDTIQGITHPVNEKISIKINEYFPMYTVLEVPGHTKDHLAYYGGGALFCGDTLFAAGCGRLFEGSPFDLYHSLQKIARLSNETKIYCGHEYTLNNLKFAQGIEPTNDFIVHKIKKVQQLLNNNQPTLPSTLQEEKETNPFLRCDSSSLILEVEKLTHHSLSDPIEVFTALRKLKDHF